MATALTRTSAFDQGSEKLVSASVEGHTFKQARPEATDAHVKQLSQPKEFVDFVTAFLVDDTEAQFGRVVGRAAHNDDSLLITDNSNGVIYWVVHSAAGNKR
ncbi:hypothetical protein Q4E40_12620 [Pontibacter sp. BT731]|uniref:hypothetical protein n=1 Tax=Pontibacter coccineus TaxID=3063328 RepID=UPI0026E2F9F8|nr:hypothetical protein [Pontibacter sp. BT731]MDO6390977.1 hypothetical protein [Pontibacter sp. BT731]